MYGLWSKNHEWTFSDPIRFKEVFKMMEFMLTMAVIAVVFVAATIVVALIAGGLFKLKDAAFKRNAENVSPK